jgi:hypothetical protein
MTPLTIITIKMTVHMMAAKTAAVFIGSLMRQDRLYPL